MNARPVRLLTVLTATAALTLSACAPSTDGGGDDSGGGGDDGGEGGGTAQVGIIYSETGPLAAYGEQYRQGLEAGIDYATDGTGEVDGTTIEVEYRDDAGNPDTAVAAAKDLIGQDYRILGGTVVSGIATAMAEQAAQNEVLYISGPAATDAITGTNEFTFRSGRQSYQDVATAGAMLDDSSGKVVVLAQDNAFGQGNLAAVEAVLGAEGAEVASVLVPEDATEFTGFARQVVDEEPDLIFVAWAGATAGNMWQSLTQQNVFDAAPVVTGLADSATFAAYGDAGEQISFLSHYFPGATDNEVNQALVDSVTEAGGTPDLFTVDGFVAGQMIVHAVAEGGDDVDGMIDALEGWEFEGPKGTTTVREGDHALVQDMFTARLVQDGDTWVPEVIDTVPADEVAPPEASGE
ncbi:Branched-chain amino acid ABC transporter, amino acid-binding protein [Serinicoccus hydrothermalis]|uniref:Branched-chain amino acid ABC transporter, amino acid-binding protein n=1 Tax=Serinicoccus hydrothermalis TaxID=1758689 RepID=A0A1B1NG13_9MICO|nr:substrate-binding domain-containing protein [Serinicoccus hydrothermalis]ANS80351.1 Branched-chain amino acid ABC transporter, amino acid-binding protein [Serinicoccus hydrothermalis]